MRKFERGQSKLPPVKEFITKMVKDFKGTTRAQAKAQYNRLMRDEIWINDKYQVAIDRDGFRSQKLTHLSIKRRDKQPIHDWRELQEIKNMLMGEEREALELYPAESRVLDVANQFHLWVLDEGGFIPAGYMTGGKADAHEVPDTCVQRPFEDPKKQFIEDCLQLVLESASMRSNQWRGVSQEENLFESSAEFFETSADEALKIHQATEAAIQAIRAAITEGRL